MRTNVRGVFAVGCLLVAAGLLSAADKEEAIKKEMQKMEGSWEIVSIEIDGNKLPLPERKKAVGTFKDGKYTVKVGDAIVDEGTGIFDPTAKPKTADAMPTMGDNKGKTLLGIYELKKDELRACFATPGKERPTEFSSKNGQMLVVYKRIKS